MEIKVIMIPEDVDKPRQESLGSGRNFFFILYKSLIPCYFHLKKKKKKRDFYLLF